MKWDDWRVLGELADGKGEEHGRRLVERDHFREAYHTPEVPGREDLTLLDRVRSELGEIVKAEQKAEKSWYKVDGTDIRILSDNPGNQVERLSRLSSVIGGMKPIRKLMIFCRPEDRAKAEAIVAKEEKKR